MHFLLHSGLGASSSLPIEELEYVTGECAGVLKQRPVTRVWVDDELRVRQMLAQRERVNRGNHDVVIPIGDEYGLLEDVYKRQAPTLPVRKMKSKGSCKSFATSSRWPETADRASGSKYFGINSSSISSVAGIASDSFNMQGLRCV